MPDLEAQTYRKITSRIVPLFCICFLVAYIDRVNVGLAKLQMLGDLGWSETIYGFGSGLFFVGYILCEVPSNMLLQRVGARLWIARIMITWGIASGLTMFVTTPFQFYVLRFLLGVAEAGFMPGVLFYFSTWYPLRRRSRITALFMLGIPLSSVVGNPLSGWIMSRFQGVDHLAGWQWLFLIEALPSILLGIVVYLWLPKSIEAARWLTDAQKSLVHRNLDGDHHASSAAAVLDALRDARVWLLGAADGTILLGLYSIAFWLPSIIKKTGVSDPFDIGLLSAIPHIAGAAAMVLIGWHADRQHERRWHSALPMLIGAAGLVASTGFAQNLTATMICMTIANAGILGAIPPFWCIPGTFLRGRAAAAGLALAGSIANLAGPFSTSLIGWLVDHTGTPAAPLIAFSLCLVLGSVIVIRLPTAIVDR
jgi:MFS family permease